MDIKMVIVQRAFDITGNVIADLLSKPDWAARSENITRYYKDLQPVMDTLPDAPAVREIPEQRVPERIEEKGKVAKIVDEICTPDLSAEEMMECKLCVEEVVRDPDVLRRYMKPSVIG